MRLILKRTTLTRLSILGLGFEAACFTWGFITSWLICFLEWNGSVFIT
jgi:hypothetical protein